MFAGTAWLPYKRRTNKKAVKNSLLKANNQTFVEKLLISMYFKRKLTISIF